MGDVIVEARGTSGQIRAYSNHLVISRHGVAAKLNHGLKGEKRIPFHSITSVQFREPKPGLGPWGNGYIQFGLLGGRESRGGIYAANNDENTVVFKSSELGEFIRVRDLVERYLENSTRAVAPAPAPDVADQLKKFAELRDSGVLTEGEFQAQKARLLGTVSGP